jgi:hypothetical protein
MGLFTPIVPLQTPQYFALMLKVLPLLILLHQVSKPGAETALRLYHHFLG